MNQSKLVSVIVPVYNMGTATKKALQCLYAQTYSNLEILVINDGSTDPVTNEICKQAPKDDPRVRLIEQANGGVSVARNTGLDAATGEYIGFMDPDDLIAPEFYEHMVAAMGDRKRTVVTCGMQRSGPSKEIIYNRYGRPIEEITGDVSAIQMQRALFRVCVTHEVRGYLPISLFRREDLADVRFVPGIIFTQDEVFFCAALNGIDTYTTLPEVLYTYCENESGSCASVRKKKRSKVKMLRNWALRDGSKFKTFLHSRWLMRAPWIGMVLFLRWVLHATQYYAVKTFDKEGV